MLRLSPEIHSKVACLLTGTNQRDLLALCLTCKALQTAVEPFLYSQITVPTPAACLSACMVLAASRRHAQYVRTFTFVPDTRSARLPASSLHTLWATLQCALENMPQLEALRLSDMAFAHSWVFGSRALPVRLRELRLRFAWDAHTVSFVARQRELRSLQIYDAIDDAGPMLHRAVDISLPKLLTFDGTLSIGVQFVTCMLERVQLTVDCESAATLAYIDKFAPLHGRLKAMCLLDPTDDVVVPVMETLVRILPDLEYIGTLPYPMTSRHRFHGCLLRMHRLRIIELDVARWNPLPNPLAVQRVLADELRVFCPSLLVIVFWVSSTTRVRWSVNETDSEEAQLYGGGHGMWQSRGEQEVYQQFGEMWSMT